MKKTSVFPVIQNRNHHSKKNDIEYLLDSKFWKASINSTDEQMIMSLTKKKKFLESKN